MSRPVAAGSWAAIAVRRTTAHSLLTLVTLTALGALAGCSNGSVDGSADVQRDTPRTEPDPSPTRHQQAKAPRTRVTSPPAPDETSPTLTAGVAMSETLSFGGLEVRAIAYRKAGNTVAATGTRVDIVTVEECAGSGSARVQHRPWRLIDAAGKTLGVAGGKIVNGHPTEDLPVTLPPGHCIQTRLAIGVPAGSVPVAVMDGPDNTWILAN